MPDAWYQRRLASLLRRVEVFTNKLGSCCHSDNLLELHRVMSAFVHPHGVVLLANAHCHFVSVLFAKNSV